MSDGQIITYGADGRPSFNVLQNHGAGPELHLYVFDLLTPRGRDRRGNRSRRDVKFCVPR